MESVQLSPSCFLYPPLPTSTGISATYTHSLAGPQVVLLTTWVFALDNHIAKYVAKYRELFPDATIIVAKSFLRHFFWWPAARNELVPVADAIYGITKDHQEETRPPMLLHLFSNTGLSTSWQLDNVFEAKQKKENKPQPPKRVTIFDSSPGRYEYWSVALSLLHGIPPGQWLQTLILVPLAHLLSGGLFIYCRILGQEDWPTKWGKAANNPSRVQEVCRSYAYSSADRLVQAPAVEAHAEDARRRGFRVVDMVDFGAKSLHVAHARSDPARYWKLVSDTWEEAMKQETGSTH
ncbi:hypothetical protein CC79DRAFT_1338293 [Sarocladium strictum]